MGHIADFPPKMSTNKADFLEPVRTFAHTILEHGQDRYGEAQTPLFVDSLNVDTKAPTPYPTAHRIRYKYQEEILANPATYQEFLRLLVGLSGLTGEDRYRDAAEAVCRYTLDSLTCETGLIKWGGHTAYDLEADRTVGHVLVHELKSHYPYYDLLWAVDPGATREYVEAMWNAHVLDWSELDFNRHGDFDQPKGDLWDNEYVGQELFFMGEGLTFVNTGSDLYYAAGMLAELTGDRAPLRWAKRLAQRYVETRQDLGISGYQFSSMLDARASGPYEGTNLTGDRAAYQFGPFVHGDRPVLEGTIFKPRPMIQRRQLVLGDRLGDRGTEFTQWSLEELRAWATETYRPASNTYEKVLTDGFTLEGFVHRLDGYYGEKGSIVDPIKATSEFFWTYAHAYRVSGDEFFWRIARQIGRGIDLGDIGEPGGDGNGLPTETDYSEYQRLYGLLELYEATGREAYLEGAAAVGHAIIDQHYEAGLFVHTDGIEIEAEYASRTFSNDARIALTGDKRPLALLHLAAALAEGSTEAIPRPGGRNHWNY